MIHRNGKSKEKVDDLRDGSRVNKTVFKIVEHENLTGTIIRASSVVEMFFCLQDLRSVLMGLNVFIF